MEPKNVASEAGGSEEKGPLFGVFRVIHLATCGLIWIVVGTFIYKGILAVYLSSAGGQ